ncbi:hypothetical protein LEP1GSC051_2153 [Leptospira sp. P2653]|nr:hypothetical protein LEP1GSC051_2153 [Leptospira sp. P2653]EMN44379.1 hypothetical protein LEP1GSC086_1624 [Leptospira weilii str. LNT 1234]
MKNFRSRINIRIFSEKRSKITYFLSLNQEENEENIDSNPPFIRMNVVRTISYIC